MKIDRRLGYGLSLLGAVAAGGVAATVIRDGANNKPLSDADATNTALNASKNKSIVETMTSTPTLMATLTGTPDERATALGEVQGTLAALQTSIAHVSTEIPTDAPTIEAPTAEHETKVPATAVPTTPEQLGENSAVIPQEDTQNIYRADAVTESQVLQNMVGGLIADYARKDQLKRANSTLASIINPPVKNGSSIDWSQVFNADPNTTPGLWHTNLDMSNYRDFYVLKDDTKILDLVRKNENGLNTGGTGVRADDKDAGVYLTTLEIEASKHPTDFANFTVGDAKRGNFSNLYAGEIVDIFNKIYGAIEKNDLPVSGVEVGRRQAKTDGTSQIPQAFWRSDQTVTCDGFRKNADSRVNQQRDLRLVTHKDGAAKTFDSSQVGEEGVLIAFSSDASGGFGIRAYTERNYRQDRYNVNVKSTAFDAAGDQEINCNLEFPPKKVKLPTATIIFGPGGEVIVSPVPNETKVVPPTQPRRVTQQPTITAQSPEKTATAGPLPGGTPTAVDTMVNTPRPTIQVQPTQPKPVPSSTPKF